MITTDLLRKYCYTDQFKDDLEKTFAEHAEIFKWQKHDVLVTICGLTVRICM